LSVLRHFLTKRKLAFHRGGFTALVDARGNIAKGILQYFYCIFQRAKLAEK